MAKRTPPEEEPYRPVNEQLARAVLAHRAPRDPNDVGLPPRDEPPGPGPQREDKPASGRQEAKPKAPPPAKATRPRRVRAARTKGAKKEPVRARRKDMTIEKRVMLSGSDSKLLDELVGGIKFELGVTVNASNVFRACLTLLDHVQDELLKQCRRVESPQRPRLDEPTSIQVFEEHLARLFDTAVRNTRSLDEPLS